MRVEPSSSAVRDPRAVITTGTFDGVHLGHQAILRYLVSRAAQVGGTPTVVTFEPHPREVLSGQPVPLLSTIAERAAIAAEIGVERMVVVPFDPALAMLEPEAYVDEVLLDTVGLLEAVIGHDHRFGHRRRGDRALLEELGRRRGFNVDVIPEQVVSGYPVSSSRIRRLLLDAGDAAGAAEMLGRPYSFAARVTRGDGRGHAVGFPTANLEPLDARKVIPAVGVYAVFAEIGDGSRRDGMMNVGRRPTFESDGATRAEVHLIGFDGDLYGRELRTHVVARLRDERRFGGIDALAAQLASDREKALVALRGG